MSTFERVKKFVLYDLWSLEVAGLSRAKRAFVVTARTLFLVVEGALQDRMAVWASSLTYITLISVVPFVALCAGIGAKMGIPAKALSFLTERIPPGQHEFLNSLAEGMAKVHFKALGITSILMLIFAAIKGLSSIEKGFNVIWGVQRGRTLWRRLADYLSVVVLAPLLILSAMAITASLLSSSFVSYLSHLPVMNVAIRVALFFVPYVAVWVALTLMYLLLPNTEVKFVPAFVGAVVAGTAWQLLQWLGFKFELSLSRYSPVFGAFTAIPAFLIWVYLSWVVVLLGAELAYAVQTARTYGFERKGLKPCFESLENAALHTSILLASRFKEGAEPLSAQEIALKLRISIRLVRQILTILTGAKLVSELRDGGYQIGRPPERITVSDVVVALRKHGDTLPVRSTELLQQILQESLRALEVPLSRLSLPEEPPSKPDPSIEEISEPR